MKIKTLFYLIPVFLLSLWAGPAGAVDETAANLVAEGKINLTLMIDTLNRKYPGEKENFWNVSGIAFHDFTGAQQSDVIIGLSGYRDKGMVYNNEKQLVEDAGSGFAYFHFEKGEWKLRQVELAEGKKYEGFEGVDLTGSGNDQLVLYSSTGEKQITGVYAIQKNGVFAKFATIAGYGLGPRVAHQSDKPQIVDYQRALVNTCEYCGIYYGRPYEWDGHKFLEQKNDFLDHVEACDLVHFTDVEKTRSLAYFEGYLTAHPKDFCAVANCFDISSRLGLKDKADHYKQMLANMGEESLVCEYCDDWTMDHNKATMEEYLNQILGKKNRKKTNLNSKF